MKYVYKKRVYIFLAFFLDALGVCVFKLFRRRSRLTVSQPKKILVVRLDHLGDVLQATGVPKTLKENYSGCQVIFLTSSWASPLLENNPFIDEIILFDAPWFSKKRYRRSGKAHGFFKLLKILRQRKIDLALGLRGDLRENLMMFLAGVKERIGYGITGGGFFLTREVAYRHEAHESEHQKDLLRVLGLKGEVLEPKIYFSEAEELGFKNRLEQFGLGGGQKYICFLLEAGAPSKDWPMANADAFLKLFAKNFPNQKVVLVGSVGRGPGQSGAGNEGCVVDLIGKTSLRELFILVKKSSFFIGPDSGPTHVAAVLGVPALFLYSGSNRYEQWKPLAESAVVLRHSVPCSPCGSEICHVEGHPCMTHISAEEAIKIMINKVS